MPFRRRLQRFVFFALLALLQLAVFPLARAAGAVKVEAVELELVAMPRGQVAESVLQLGLRVRHDPHWHTYWRNPGDSGLPTQIHWNLPAEWKAGEIAWPHPARIPVGPLANYGYEGEIVLPVLVNVPRTAWRSSEKQRLQAKVSWLMCKDVCIPGEALLELTLALSPTGKVQAEPASATSQSMQALLAAALESRPQPMPSGGAWFGSFIAPQNRELLLVPGAALQAQLQQARSAEFFPYEEGVIKPSAPQTLLRLVSGALALHVPLQEFAPPQGWPPQLNGVLSVNAGSQAKHYLVQVASGQLMVGDTDWKAALANPIGVAAVATVSSASGGLRERLGTSSASPQLQQPQTDAPLVLWTAAAFGLVGGMLLNLMPCVFPVLSLKVLALTGEAASPQRARRQGLLFSLGVLCSFFLLAVIMLTLRSAGHTLGWGFQLQSPWMVALLSLLFVAIGLNFFGLFEVGLMLTRLSAPRSTGASAHSGVSAFGSGLLAAVVAAPCSAPFMGSAVGFTLDQSGPITLLVFMLVGLGMAMPYAVLSWWPGLLRRLPKPGAWMETLKQGLAFPMFLTAVWLAWVLGAQQGNDAVAWLAVAAVTLSLVLWLYGRWQRGGSRASLVFVLLGAGAVVWIVFALVANEIKSDSTPSASAVQWLAYDRPVAEQHVAAGKTVFLEFTAAWCISCQANKALVFESELGRRALSAPNVVAMRADWTRRDAIITNALAGYGRNSVPLYVVLAPNRAAQLLPELLTNDILRKALEPSR